MQTLGQKAMRVDFSPNEEVTKIKQMFADLYDQVNAISTHNKHDDSTRWVEDAKYNLEVACMFAVKALTL
jgi:hypothetical protein